MHFTFFSFCSLTHFMHHFNSLEVGGVVKQKRKDVFLMRKAVSCELNEDRKRENMLISTQFITQQLLTLNRVEKGSSRITLATTSNTPTPNKINIQDESSRIHQIVIFCLYVQKSEEAENSLAEKKRLNLKQLDLPQQSFLVLLMNCFFINPPSSLQLSLSLSALPLKQWECLALIPSSHAFPSLFSLAANVEVKLDCQIPREWNNGRVRVLWSLPYPLVWGGG